MLRDLVLTTPPALELVTLDEVKAHLRLEGIDDRDETLQAHLEASIGGLDGYAGRLGRALAPQTWTLYLDSFPSGGSTGSVLNAIRLPLPPLISVTSVTYVDSAGLSQTLVANTDYETFPGERAEIRPAYGKTWPSARSKARAVAIVFQAGFAPLEGAVWAAKVQPVRSAIKLMVEDLFRGQATNAPAVNSLLKPLTLPRV